MAIFDPAPLAQAAADLAKTGADLTTSVIEHGGQITTDVQAAVESLLGKIDSYTNQVLDRVKAIATAAQAPPPLPPPVDAVATLDQIAQAVTNAETVLNKYGLVIATGSVDAEINIKLPGGAGGAVAKISFQITPKPTN